MDYVRLGKTGLKISRIALGCMSYGDPTTTNAHTWGEQSHRSSVDKVVKAFDSPLDEPVVNAVRRVSEARGASMAQVALAWVLNSPAVSAPIVGATKPHHLPEAIAALDLHLTHDEIRSLEEPYTSHGPSWF